MNHALVSFFTDNYAPGRICLIGATDLIYEIIRKGQSSITPDGKPSLWNHTFLLGKLSGDSISILESDLHIDFKKFQVINGPQESALTKWCTDTVEHACVLGMDLTETEQQAVLKRGADLANDSRYTYPVGELFGTLWAMWTKTLHKKNIFDMKYAVQCATFVRMCYQSIGKDPLSGVSDSLANTSPERMYQGTKYMFRKEWHR